jgi:hypothetical protein
VLYLSVHGAQQYTVCVFFPFFPYLYVLGFQVNAVCLSSPHLYVPGAQEKKVLLLIDVFVINLMDIVVGVPAERLAIGL